MSRLAEPTAREKALADRATVLRPAGSKVLARLQLTPEEGFLLSRLDRAQPLGQVLAAAGMAEPRALQVLLTLVHKGAVLLPGDPEPEGRGSDDSPWGDFIFNPADLNEPVELDLEKKKQILFLSAQLSKLSHYRLLGVSPLATPGEVRKAFLERSKQFHPDNFFRKNLGSYAARLGTLFQRLKVAADTLMDPEERRRYDRESAKQFTSEEKAALVEREIALLEEEQRAKARRERLLHARGFVRLTRAREVMAEADVFLAEGDVGRAAERYQLASELDPRLEEAKTRLAEVRRVGEVRRADLALDEAERARAEGRRSRAAELLRTAAELDPANGRVQFALGRVLSEDGGDWKEIRQLAQRAVECGETGPAVRLLLGEALLKLGLKKNARRELEAALAGGEERARPLLRQC